MSQNDDILVGDGFPGIREIKQEPQNIESIIPASRIASRFSTQKDLTLPEEYTAFLEQYPRSILVAFGTTWMPSDDQVGMILEAIKKQPNIGFVLSLKEAWTSYKMTQEMALPNILLKPFVPQKELLNDDRIIAFITHGGANSILESMYYGTALIGFPLAGDQLGGCYRMERMGLGISLRDTPSTEKIIAAIERIQSDDHFSKNMKRIQKMIEFRELRSGKDMAYFMRRTIKFHEWSGGKSSSHL